jgi:hypothetical protein
MAVQLTRRLGGNLIEAELVPRAQTKETEKRTGDRALVVLLVGRPLGRGERRKPRFDVELEGIPADVVDGGGLAFEDKGVGFLDRRPRFFEWRAGGHGKGERREQGLARGGEPRRYWDVGGGWRAEMTLFFGRRRR